MATDSTAGPQSSESLDERSSEAYSHADLDSAATLASLSGGEAPETTEGESNCVKPTDPHSGPLDAPGRTDDGHSAPAADTNSTSLAEGVTGADSEECPSTPLLEGTDQTEEGEVREGGQEEAAPPGVRVVKTPSELECEQQSTNTSEPVEQAEGHAYEKEGDLTESGHTLVNASNPQEGSGVTDEPSAETGLEPLDAPDSPIVLSDSGVDAGDLSVDHQRLDFSVAREQWARRDSLSGKLPTPTGSRRSSVCRALDLPTALTSQLPLAEEAASEAEAAIAAGDQQGEGLPHSPSVLQQKQEGQQVCGETPPMETVARKLANQVAESPGASPAVLKEPLTEKGEREGEREREREGEREGEREREREGEREGEGEAERESGQTNGEQTAASIHTGDTQEDGHSSDTALKLASAAHANASAGPVTARSRMEDPYDDNQSDSGVSADFSAEVSGRTPASDSPEPRKPPPPPANETPIEREIRLAAEREQSLRQARGLATSDRGAEFVEIPARRVPLLSQELPPGRAVKDKGKERQFAGKKMQREISQETQREQDLVQLGRVQAGYEKGTVRQLRERKLLFEAFQQSFEVPASPRKGSMSAGDLFAGLGGGAPGDDDSSASSSACGSERRHSLELLSSSAPSARGPGLSEGTSGQIIIMEGQRVSQMPLSSDADRTPHAAPGPGALAEAQALTVVDSPAPPYVEMEQEEEAQEEEAQELNSVMVRENPFFKLRSSMSMRPQVERDIRQAQERERELRKQRSSLYQGAAGAEGPNAHNGLLGTHTRSSTASVIRPQTDTAHREQTEAQKSPPGVVRTPRQKSSLVQRWEAGMVNGQED